MTGHPVRKFLGVGVAGLALSLLALSFVLPQPAHAILSSTAFQGVVTDSVSGNPIPDAQVYLIDGSGNMVAFDLTTAGGAYALSDVPIGTYRIEVEAENYARFSLSGLNFGGPVVTKNISLVAYKLAFKGRVTDSVTAAPISGADVLVLDQANPGNMYAFQTLADGAFEIYAPAGTYAIDVDADKYAPTTVIDLAFDGTNAVTKDFTLVKSPLAFKGIVTDSVTHLPIMDASVTVYDADGNPVEEAYSASNGAYEVYVPAGTYDIEVLADAYHSAWASLAAFNGTTPIVKNFTLVPPIVTRVAGKNRYETAAKLARKGWDPAGNGSWPDVKDIIIANGETGKEADPVAAAGLAGAYDAPLLLTQVSALPGATKQIIAEIALKNPGVRIHLIGGTAVVPDARWNNIKAIPGVSGTKHRVWGSDRYKTSAEIAKAVVAKVGADGIGGVILIAGDNPAAFFDALAASPISYVNQMPMLAVKKASIPSAVNDVLISPAFKGLPRYAASGTTYLSSIPAKGAVRLVTGTGSSRYTAAAQIAEFAINQGWLGEQDTALASSLPDALTGGAFQGRNYGVLLFTDSTSRIQLGSKTFIEDYAGLILDGWVIGGTTALPSAQETTFRNLIK